MGLKVFDDGSVEITDYGTAGEKIAFDKIPSCKGMKFVGWRTGGSNEIIIMRFTNRTPKLIKWF